MCFPVLGTTPQSGRWWLAKQCVIGDREASQLPEPWSVAIWVTVAIELSARDNARRARCILRRVR
jgi:hypothetical protein